MIELTLGSQLSALSSQLSALSSQLSALGSRLSAFSFQLFVSKGSSHGRVSLPAARLAREA
jgi:hypothetical protein